ncbi:Conserved transmembrane protein [Methanosarcina sp. Kolksee]|uniref:DUF2206 domain-containing protein n=1 Tax=Methanosarcina sp. Kolksee TaxID=1434099 RepID=UPI000615F3BC|nr:DUF2206 domain-containing protein [Methanosarcina sp. Kolksee]AKB46558.1 Conserved transmembrane protein [Methanosarcina sp. Kolksee]
MKIKNIFQMNDWEISSFFYLIFSLELGLMGSIGLDLINLHVPFIREIIGVVYLIFVPGVLILRILRLHNLGNITTFLYTVGLSIASLMFVGFFVNIIFPSLGIQNPISTMYLTFSLTVFILFLCILCFIKDRDFSDTKIISCKILLDPQLLLFLLLPFFSIFGTYLVNYYHSNIILMFTLLIISFLLVLIGFDKGISENLFPISIWAISISLFYFYSLITKYPSVLDQEVYVAKSTIENAYWAWDANTFTASTTVLSISILPPIFYFICNIDLTWIYKVIFPFIMSLIPIGIYLISSGYLSKKCSFLSAVLFVINPFIFNVIFISKQMLSMLFLVLVFILLFNTKIDKVNKSILLIIFSTFVIVSHYGTSYLVMFSFIFVILFSYFDKIICNCFSHFTKNCDDSPSTYKYNLFDINFSLNYVFLYIVITLAWYMYISDSYSFQILLRAGRRICETLFSEFFNPAGSRGAYMLTKEHRTLGTIRAYLNLSVAIFLVIGLAKELYNHMCNKSKFNVIYLGFASYFTLILVASVAISHFAAMSPERLFILSLPLVAPFCIIGGLTFFQKLFKKFEFQRDNKIVKLLFVYFTIFMLFNTQFVDALLNDHVVSIAIGQNYIEKSSDLEDISDFYSTQIVEYDVTSLYWLSNHGYKNKKLFFTGGYSRVGCVLESMGYFPIENINTNLNRNSFIPNDNYILLLYANVVKNIGFGLLEGVDWFTYFKMDDINPIFTQKDKIYTNGGSEILLS